jgi:hypothetical protein
MRFYSLSIITTVFLLSLIAIVGILNFYPEPNQATLLYLENNCKTFELAEKLARQDFQTGTYRLVFDGGLGSGIRTEIRNRLLKDYYDVEVISTGCIGSTEEVYCYNQVMANLLGEKFGYDFYDCVKGEVKREYDALFPR